MKIISLDLFLNVCIFLIGASLGSFINMAAYRIPKSLSILIPRSYCNYCKVPLSFLALIPIFGYLFSRGRCAKCKTHIPFEYPLIELLCGTFFVFVWNYYDILSYYPLSLIDFKSFLIIPLLTSLWLFSTGLLLSIIDFKHRILPDVIVLPGIIINFFLGGLNPNLGFKGSIIGIATGGIGLFLIAKFYSLIRKKEGMGFGDVKYLGFLGAVLGWQGVILTLFSASILGSILGISWLLIQKKNLHTPIPFGPFLALSALVYFLLTKNFSIL